MIVGLGATAVAQDDLGPNQTEVERMMEAYVLSKIQESLELDDDQYGRMAVAQKNLQQARREYRRDRMSVLRKMRQTLRQNRGGDEELTDLLGQLETLKDEFAAKEKAGYDAIDDILDVRQRARYRILEQEIQRRLQQMLRRVRNQGQGNRNPRRPFP